MKICETIESDEVYVTAGLKDKNKSRRIRRIDRKPRKKDLKRRRLWRNGRPQSSYLLGGTVGKTIFHQGMLSLKQP
jgi:hypothetical protein